MYDGPPPMGSLSRAEIISKVLFSTGHPPLREAAKSYLDLVVGMLKWNSKRNAIGKVETAQVLNY